MGDYVKKAHDCLSPQRNTNVFYPYLIDNITLLEARAKIDALDDMFGLLTRHRDQKPTRQSTLCGG